MHDLVIHVIDFHFFYSALSGSPSDDNPIPLSSGELSNPVSDMLIGAIPQFFFFFDHVPFKTVFCFFYFLFKYSSTFYSIFIEYCPTVHNIKCFTEVNIDFMGLKKILKIDNQSYQ